MSEEETHDQTPSEGVGAFLRGVAGDRLAHRAGQLMELAFAAVVFVVVVLFGAGGTVPAWVLGLVVTVCAVALIVLRRYLLGRFQRTQAEYRRRVDNLRADLRATGEELDRRNAYATHLCQVLDHYQRILAGDIKSIGPSEFIEHGILEPARDVMRKNGHAEDIRFSVLIAEGDDFRMYWAAGHNLESKSKYCRPIKKTLARIAFETKAQQSWKDAPSDRSFMVTPKATRPFRAMVSDPIMIGDKCVGTFNVITDRLAAFDDADKTYITSLGSVIQVAVGVVLKEEKESQRTARSRRFTPPLERVASVRSSPVPKEQPDA
jgi:hypothetical protein